MEARDTVHVDPERCIGCARCTQACPHQTLTLVGPRAQVTGEYCMGCCHCAASCPVEAITVDCADADALDLQTLDAPRDQPWLPHGEYDTAGLVRLMRSRRSCRHYTEQPVERAVLEDLVRIGISAPSGTNSQRWTFTLLPDRAAVVALADEVAAFFRRLNRLAESRTVRLAARLVGKPALSHYHRELYPSVKRRLEQWERTGHDSLFHGAPAAILVGATPGGSCPQEDALLATQNILLAAHSLGLGTCLLGYVVAALREAPKIKAFLGLPAEERVYAVIGLGHPSERYRRVAGRRRVEPRWFEAPTGSRP